MRDRDGPPESGIDKALAAIGRELELLRAGPNLGGPDDNAALIARLEAEYRALEAARANRDAGRR